MANTIFEQIDDVIEKMQAVIEQELQQNPQFYAQYPMELLTEANPRDIEDVTKRWTLPEPYVYFLQHYVPERVGWATEDYIHLHIFGASELQEGQIGYNYNPVTQEVIEDWPAHYLVIASDEGDPYCLDLSRKDTAVYTALHGQGEWDFSIAYDSLVEFLYSTLVPKGIEVLEPSELADYKYYKLWLMGEGNDRVKTLLFIKKLKNCNVPEARAYLAELPLLVFKGIEQRAMQMEQELKTINADYKMEQIGWEEFIREDA